MLPWWDWGDALCPDALSVGGKFTRHSIVHFQKHLRWLYLADIHMGIIRLQAHFPPSYPHFFLVLLNFRVPSPNQKMKEQTQRNMKISLAYSK